MSILDPKLTLNISLRRIIIYGAGFAGLRMLVGAVSAVYLFSRGVSIEELGWLKSYQFLLVLLLDIPISYWADNVSRKLSVLLAGACAALELGLTALASSLVGFYVAETFNALSLLLFNGAFIAYLIEQKNALMPTLDSKTLLGLANKYDSLLMAGASFVGAVFISASSTTIWYVAGGALLLWTGIFIRFLPKDTTKAAAQKSAPPLKQATSELGLVLKFLHAHRLRVFIALSLMAMYLQLLIQLWQPILWLQNAANALADKGFIYGSALAVIFLAQSLAGHCVSKYSHQPWAQSTVFALLMLLPIPLFVVAQWVNAALAQADFAWIKWAGFAWQLLALALLFLLGRFCMIVLSGFFHDSLHGDHARLRASFEALSSVATKVLLLGTFPVATWLLDGVGVLALMALLSVLGAALAWMMWPLADPKDRDFTG